MFLKFTDDCDVVIYLALTEIYNVLYSEEQNIFRITTKEGKEYRLSNEYADREACITILNALSVKVASPLMQPQVIR